MDKANNIEIVNAEGAKIIWQPVMMVPVNTHDPQTLNYPNMKVISIRVFSSICIILGIASIGVQIAALVIYATSLFRCVVSEMDVVGHGIWAGVLYLTTGSLAIAASHKRTQSLMVGTVVLAILSLCASIVASTLSGIAAAHGIYISCYYQSSYFSSLCDAWLYLEWTLTSISILAFLSTLTLVFLMSLGLFNKHKSSEGDVSRLDKYANQPFYFKPQSTSKLPSQQCHRPAPSNLQVVYVAQEEPQPQSLQLVPISVQTLQPLHQQPPVSEAKNIRLQLEKQLTANNKDSKKSKITIAQTLK